jgi:hypothetical protein
VGEKNILAVSKKVDTVASIIVTQKDNMKKQRNKANTHGGALAHAIVRYSLLVVH